MNMPIVPERIAYLTDLVFPYFTDDGLAENAPQHIIDAFKELKDWADMQDQ